MVDEEVIQVEKKDVTDEFIENLINDEELEEELQGELEEVEEVEGVEEKPKKALSEDEFLEQVEYYEEKNHYLTLMLDRFFKLLAKYGKKHDVEVDLELWDEVAKPSLNVGFWYYQLVEGHNIMLSYPKLSLGIGLIATAVIGLSALSQIRGKKREKKKTETKKVEKKEVKGEQKEILEKAQRVIEGKKVEEEENEIAEEFRERAEELKANADLLAKVNKNLSSS